jgi:hypothetical protein
MSVEALVNYFKELSVDVTDDVRWESLREITYAILNDSPMKFDLLRLGKNCIDDAAITALADALVVNQSWLMEKDSSIIVDDLVHSVAKNTAGNLCLDCKGTDPFGIRPYIYPAIYAARHPPYYRSSTVICDECNDIIDGEGVHYMGQNKDLCTHHSERLFVLNHEIASHFIHRLNGTHPLSVPEHVVDKNARVQLLEVAWDILHSTEVFKEQKARYKGKLNLALLTDDETDVLQNSLAASSYRRLPAVLNKDKVPK